VKSATRKRVRLGCETQLRRYAGKRRRERICHPRFPLRATDEAELQAKLSAGGHFLPLPKEPAALANIIEVAVVDYLIRSIKSLPDATIVRGTERGYPDVEIGGAAFGGGLNNPHQVTDTGDSEIFAHGEAR